MGEYNPDRPYVMGMQWAPLLADTVLLDTGSEVGYTFRARTSHPTGDGLRRVHLYVATPPPGLPTRKELLVNLYPADRVAGTGPVRKLVIPARDGALLAGAALAGGSSMPPDAVQNPSDPRHITLTGPNAAARFWFDTNSQRTHAKLDGRRILDVSVLYVMSGPFADLAPAVTLGLERPSAGVNWLMDETLTGPATHSGITAVGRSRLGELNPWWSTAAAPTVERGRVPWRSKNVSGTGVPAGLAALAASGGTNINVRLQVSASAAPAAVFQLHYLALEVTYGEENRVGGGGLSLSEGAGFINGYFYDVPIWDAETFSSTVQLTAGREYAVTVGQAYAGQLSVASPVPVRADRLGPIELFPSHQGVLLRKTLREAQTPTVETAQELPSLVLFSGPTAPGTPDLSGHSYLTQVVATVSELAPQGWTMQQIVEERAADWVWARFYARHLPGTRHALELAQVNPLDTTQRLGPVARVTVEEFDALPEIADGWREVTARLDPPYLSDGVGGVTWWTFTSSADGQSPWQVLGADANPMSGGPVGLYVEPGYGGRVVHATVDGQSDESADLTLMFAQEMDAVAGLMVEPAVQPLVVVDEQCGRPTSKIPTGIRFHRLSWTPLNTAVVAGWGYYEVQRQDDTMTPDVWETIAKVAEPTVAALDDYEARVGVQSRYRIRMMHRLGIAGPWSAPVAATIAAPGVEGRNVDTGVLILTSNHNPDGNLAYVANFDRSTVEEFAFPEAGQVELQEMFDRDYRTAFRPLERGGAEFTRTVLVNAAAVPPATLDRGFQDLRDLAWDTVPYVCVRDELNNRWLSTLLVPSGQVKRRKVGQLQLAQVQVVEVTATPAPVAGGPAPCEGLRPEGLVPAVTASTPVPAAAIAPEVFFDSMADRTVAAGLGNGWTIVDGPAEDFSVDSGRATIQLSLDSARRAVVGTGWADVDVRARLRFNAVAAGGPISAYLLGRHVSSSNYYRARLVAQTDGTLGLELAVVAGGVVTMLVPVATLRDAAGGPRAYGPGAWYEMRLQVRGAAVRAAVWPVGEDMWRWDASASDGSMTGAGQVGVRAFLSALNTNVGVTLEFADVRVSQPTSNDLDVRVELRPTGDEWTAELSRTSDDESTGWLLAAGPVSTCLTVWGGTGIQDCRDTQDMVVTRQRRWLRVTYVNDYFGGEAVVQFWWSEDGVAWVDLGGTFPSPEPPTVDPGRLALVLTGAVSVARIEVRDGVDGPVLAAPDFESQPAGTTSFVDGQGNQWEVDGRGICASA